MKVILTVLCRDEEDIIEEFCRFHLYKGVDHIVATDNGSTDQTRNILLRFSAKGLLTLIEEPKHNHDQAIWVSRMAKIAATQLKADWVIHSDADEFWWPNTGNFKTVFRKIHPSTNALKVKRTNFLPPKHQDSKMPFWQSMLIREYSSFNSLGSPLPPKVCHRAIEDVFIEDGNHQLSSSSTPITSINTDDIEILHFPIRSYWQFERKIRQGAEALARNNRIQSSIGGTWKYLYSEYLKKHSLYEYYCELRPDDSTIKRRQTEKNLILDTRISKHMSFNLLTNAKRILKFFISK